MQDQKNGTFVLLRQIEYNPYINQHAIPISQVVQSYQRMGQLDSPYIDRVYHIYDYNFKAFIILEHSPKETLEYFHKRMYLSFNERIIKSIAYQVCEAMHVMHSQPTSLCFKSLEMKNLSKKIRNENVTQWTIVVEEFENIEEGNSTKRREDIVKFGFLLYSLIFSGRSQQTNFVLLRTEPVRSPSSMRKKMKESMIGPFSSDFIETIISMVFDKVLDTAMLLKKFAPKRSPFELLHTCPLFTDITILNEE